MGLRTSKEDGWVNGWQMVRFQSNHAAIKLCVATCLVHEIFPNKFQVLDMNRRKIVLWCPSCAMAAWWRSHLISDTISAESGWPSLLCYWQYNLLANLARQGWHFSSISFQHNLIEMLLKCRSPVCWRRGFGGLSVNIDHLRLPRSLAPPWP